MISSRLVRLGLAVLPTLAAFVIQMLAWPALQPFAWASFIPAVFLASWIGGRSAGLLSTGMSILLGWIFFLPPEGALIKNQVQAYVSAAVFIGIGVLFSVFHDRLRRAHRQITQMLDDTRETELLKARLYARFSHELRTPLGLIHAPVERALTSPGLSPELRSDVAMVHRNVRIMTRLVDELLDIAKLGVGETRVEYERADVSAIVRFVCSIFEPLAAERKLTFVVDAPAALPAQVDANQLRRIVQNLVSNAFKFTPDGGQVRVTLREADDRFVLEVADDGPTIPVDRRDDVFVPFRQLDDAVTHRFGGSALGLAIVRELAELHRGRASVGEAPEGGALFIVEIPRTAPAGTTLRGAQDPARNGEAAAVREMVEELRESPSHQPLASGSGPLVLVVEDNREMNQFISKTLAAIDSYRVVSAYDGAHALTMAVEQHPDIIVTDIVMPELDGDALVHAIRQRHELDTTPIVVLSALADDARRVDLLRTGADDYLVKPFSAAELSARVGNLVSRKRAEDDTRRLIHQLDDVAEAHTAVSEAIAGLPASSVDAVMQTIALKARSLTLANYAAVAIGAEPGVPFDQWISIGVDPARASEIGRTPRCTGVLALVARQDTAVRLDNLRDSPEFAGFPPHHPIMTSLLGVPIRYRGRTVGTIFLADKQDDQPFTDQDQRIVEMLAARVGSAIETARLYRAEGMERAWLQAVVDQMPEGVLLVDALGQVTTQNRASVALGGNNRAARVTDAVQLRHPDGHPLAVTELPVARALAHDEAVLDVELLACPAQGQAVPVPVLVSAAPVRGPDGELAGATMILRDVSAQRQIEQMRREWAEMVAHDLQQPVNSIVLGTDLVLSSQLGDKERERIERIRGSALRLGRMVHDLRDVSAIEARHLSIQRKTVDLTGILRGLVRHSTEASRLALHDPDAAIEVSGDPDRLEQVFENLISNAAKYDETGSKIQITVTATPAHATVTVTNAGIGIAADELATVFDRYARTRGARHSGAPGSGLGLYIARGLIEVHGGRIWAESVPGLTTSFHVELPRLPPRVS